MYMLFFNLQMNLKYNYNYFFKELRRLTDEYSKHKQSCELIQSEIIKLQQVESSVTIQLQMNEQAISHLNEQIEKKHQKGTYILYYD